MVGAAGNSVGAQSQPNIFVASTKSLFNRLKSLLAQAGIWLVRSNGFLGVRITLSALFVARVSEYLDSIPGTDILPIVIYYIRISEQRYDPDSSRSPSAASRRRDRESFDGRPVDTRMTKSSIRRAVIPIAQNGKKSLTHE